MKIRFIIGALCGILIVITASCAALNSAGHKYVMRGQVLGVTDDIVYLCIGSKDGAVIGQEYSVYTFIQTKSLNKKGNERLEYTKKDTGTVKLTEIVDEHYAKAKITAGEAKVNYVVELRQ